MNAAHTSANLLLAYSVYAFGTASPGPSNLAVMAKAMDAGRRQALLFALGVVSGSTLWGLLAAFGLSAILASCSGALVAMKILGGLYLAWLASKSARSAISVHSARHAADAARDETALNTYARGAAMHLTNPKAIFVWLSLVSLALPAGARTQDALLVVAGCACIGVAVFCGYALAFSTPAARHLYQQSRRWFEGALALVFGYAAARTLASGM